MSYLSACVGWGLGHTVMVTETTQLSKLFDCIGNEDIGLLANVVDNSFVVLIYSITNRNHYGRIPTPPFIIPL